ncbi:MAG: hypothetical protein ACPKM0_07250 [Pleomorphochaeta sp.]
MNNTYANTFLDLPQFEITKNPTFLYENKYDKEYKLTIIHGKSTAALPRECSHCKRDGLINHIYKHPKVNLKHLSCFDEQIIIEVEYLQLICPSCGKITNQEIVFKQPKHFITKCFFNQIYGMLQSSKIPIKTISQTIFCNRKLITAIDKQRLKEKYGDMKPTHYSSYLAVDEFSIRKGHKYATVVMDWMTGEILFIEEGNSELQLIKSYLSEVLLINTLSAC